MAAPPRGRGGRNTASGRNGNRRSEAKKGPTYAEGLYLAVCTGQRFSEYENENRTPFIGISFRPSHKLDPIYPDDIEKAEKVGAAYEREIKMPVTSATVKAGVFPKQLRAAGWSTNSIADLDPSSESFEDLSGNEFKVRCSHRKTPEGTFEDWAIFTPGGGKKRENKVGVAAKLGALFDADISASVEPAEKKSAGNSSKRTTAATGAEKVTKGDRKRAPEPEPEEPYDDDPTYESGFDGTDDDEVPF